jgi:tRNA(fMet)-specific endonuclease VapC
LAVDLLFLDSDVCINVIRRRPAAIAWFARQDSSRLALPAVVVAELYFGANKPRTTPDDRAALDLFLGPLPVIPFDERAAEHYGFIRNYLEMRGEIIGPNDLLIAATALAHRATLVTGNKREFLRVPGLRVKSIDDLVGS